MPSARELKMRQILEEKKKAILTEQQGSVANTPKPASKSPLSTSNPTKGVNLRFQAIGIVYGQVRQESEEKFFVNLSGERECRLWVAKSQQPGLSKTLEQESFLYLKVYPKVWVSPEGDPYIYLHLVHWLNSLSWAKNSWDEEVNVFQIRGIWQVHPQSKTRIIAVYRNHVALDSTGLYKATYLPVEMERSDVEVFNPRKKSKQPTRWFIQGHFRLNQKLTKLIWVEDTAKPTTLIPKYKKPQRKNY